MVEIKRKGSLVVVVIFSMMMAIISFGLLGVATALYVQNEDSSGRYANLQTYRAATEIAAYQYCNDLQTVIVTRSLSGEWLNVTGSAVITQSLEEIQKAVSTNSNNLVWKVGTIQEAVSGASVSNPQIMVNLLGLLNEGVTNFKLSVADTPQIDYSTGEGYISADESMFKLQPIEMHIHLTALGESLDEVLYVDGLYIHILRDNIIGVGGFRDTVFTIKVIQGESGVQIYRV